MGDRGTIRVAFDIGDHEMGRFWQPVIIELKRERSRKVIRTALEDYTKLKKDNGTYYVEIEGIPRGTYTLKVIDADTGRPIVKGQTIELDKDKVEHKFEKRAAAKQPNTPAMDLVVDAPYRLEKSCPYVPVIVYLKDVGPVKIRIRSIAFNHWTSSSGGTPQSLPPGSIVKVLDTKGAEVEENGMPAPLRFDEGEDYETVNTDPWYRIIHLDRKCFTPVDWTHPAYGKARYLHYCVIITFEGFLGIDRSKQIVLRTLVSEYDLPRVDGWLYGDTHFHSDFTDNPYEYGSPLPMSAEVARATGLAWVTVTDHSYCLGHTKTDEEEEQGNRWSSYKKAVADTNIRYPDVLLVAAEEVTVRKYFAGLHVLSYDNPFIEDTHIAGFGTLTMAEVFERILLSPQPRQGFLYAAHPSSNGYIWHEEDYAVVMNPRYRDLFCGLQIFNEKILMECTTDSSIDRPYLDPYEMFKKTDKKKSWSHDLDTGIREHWVEHFLRPSLREYTQIKTLKKYFVLAGSDAHMDFNCAFRPHPVFFIHTLNDNAFGKVRTLAYLPKEAGEALTEADLLGALKAGRALLSDGPIVFFSLRKKGDEKEYRFGDTFTIPPGESLDLHIEWQSNEEFGPIERIHLFRGTADAETDITDEIGLPTLGNKESGFHGSIVHTFSAWTESPCYLRMEAASRINPKTGEGLFRCVTNPIWIVTE